MVRNYNRMMRLILVIIGLFVTGTTLQAQFNPRMSATVIKQPLCGCDGEVRIDFWDCQFLIDKWRVYGSNTNTLSLGSSSTWFNDTQNIKSSGNGSVPSSIVITGLCPGDWYFRVAFVYMVDNNGNDIWSFARNNSTNNFDALHVVLQGSSTLNCDVSVNDCDCYHKDAVGTASGGTPPYTYTWERTSNPAGPIPNGSKLTAGTYKMTVTDANGCKCEKIFTVTTEEAMPNISLKVTPKGCNPVTANGGCVEIIGDVAGKPIVWKKTHPVMQTGPTGNATQWCVLQPGDKGYVRIIDVETGCVLELEWEIPPFTPITFSLKTRAYKDGTNCYGVVEAIDLAGGDAPFTIQWDNGPILPHSIAANRTRTKMLPASFTVTIRDKNGCEHTQTVNMTCPPGLRTVSINPNPATTSADVYFDVTNTANYSYKVYNNTFSEVGNGSLGIMYPGLQNFNLNVSSYQAGLYFVLIEEDGTPDPVMTQLIKQ